MFGLREVRKKWETYALGELCDVLDSKRKPVTKRDRVPGIYPYYGATGILDHVDGYLFDEPLVLVGEDGAKWSAGEKSAFPINGKCWVNNHAHVLRPNRKVLLDSWLVYYLNCSDLIPFTTGLTVPKLNQGKLNQIPIPTPPIVLQNRIVEILDAAFASIETAIANTEKNLTNIRELFETNLANVLGVSSLEKNLDNVEALTFGDLCEFRRGLTYKKSDEVPVSQNAILRANNVTSDTGEINLDEIRYIRDEIKIPASKMLKPDCLLICTASGSKKHLGKVGLVEGESNYAFGGFMGLLVPSEKVMAKYLFWLTRTKSYRDFIENLSEGTNINNLKWSQLSQFPVPVPPLFEQERIVAYFDEFSAKQRSIIEIYETKIGALTELKQSFLFMAFAGALTADSTSTAQTFLKRKA